MALATVYDPSSQTIVDRANATSLAGAGLTTLAGQLVVNVDNSTLENSAGVTRVKDLGVTVAKLAAAASLRLTIVGTADPSAGGGVAAAPGMVYLRDAAGANGGQLWVKTGDADTAWTQVTVP